MSRRTKLLLASVILAAAATPTRPTETVGAEKLLYLLEYLAVDYGAAVRDGAVVNLFEFNEMLSISKTLVSRADDLIRRGAPEEIRAGLGDLRGAIVDRRPESDVRRRARELARILYDELDTVSLPAAAPDLERGRRLYEDGCAPCHGPSGGGDGRAAAGMEPTPTSFRDARMNLVPAHQVWAAATFGIDATAMPSFAGAFTAVETWDVAFFVLTLRADFTARAPEPALPLTLRDLALLSNQELLELARRTRPDARPEHVDYHRLGPPSELHPARRTALTRS